MSRNKINFLRDFIPNDFFFIKDPLIKIFHIPDFLEWQLFLNELSESKFYVIEVEFVPNWDLYDEDGPTIKLCKPFLVTKFSNPSLISDFIMSKIKDSCYTFDLNFEIKVEDMNKIKPTEVPGIIIIYKEITIF
uniref:Uncharacterized protein n=1 Tax=Russula virescens TaxID=71688 RepID=A0A2S0U3Z9_9AGAM|nr:hypothetical protein [Russula virescens]AWB36219.1 hypothetical protein [Russula virescens]